MKKHRLSSSKIIVLGFLAMILLGTLLLCLPFASTDGHTHFVDALFTATSATCVTGLVTLTTAAHWTLFGKIIILILIQIGGLGFMTFIAISAIIAKKHFSLHERKLMVQSTGSLELSGIIKLIKGVVLGTFLVEGIGALALSIHFWCNGHSFGVGLWYGIFHSISAFCNAGFDILGDTSLESYKSDPVFLIIVSLLIVIGGIGFLVWGDFKEHGFKFKKYKLHSKLALATTGALLVGGTLLFYITEYNNAFASLNEGEKWLNALFQSVTLRTAGFASVSQAELSTGGVVGSVVLMLIGGSPGSTAGGIKTVTFSVIILNALCFARNKNSLTVFKRRIHDDTVKQACAIISIYLLAVCLTVILVTLIESGNSQLSLDLDDAVFEVVSAIGTVGLTRGITPLLSVGSKLIICASMFFGRMGGLTLLLAIAEKQSAPKIERPFEKILIG